MAQEESKKAAADPKAADPAAPAKQAGKKKSSKEVGKFTRGDH